MKKFIILLAVAAAVLLCLPSGLKAQQVDTNPVELPSTTVWQQMKFNNVAGASLYTGTMRLSVPVYTYHDADFDIPISLDYSTNGFRPNVMTSLVGHEWGLGLGGAVSRIVRGLPDEHRSAGLFGFQELHNLSSLTSVDQIDGFVTEFDDLSIAATSPHIYYAPAGFGQGGDHYDMEPDIFQFNFLGHSGKFMLGYGGAIHVFDTDTRSSEYRIEVPAYNLDQIVIVSGDGTRYTFGSGNAREFAGDVTTAWKLSRIDTPSGRSVVFSYTRSPRGTTGNLTYTTFNSYAPDTHCYSFSGGYYDQYHNWHGVNIDHKPTLPVLGTVMTVSAPDSVVFDNGAFIEFFYANPAQLETGDGMSLVNLPKLDRIVVRAPGGTAVCTCSLSYAYPSAASSNKICFLSSVSITGEGTYSFDYNYNASTVFPKHGTFKIDHWGYYSNASVTAGTFYTHTTQGDYLEETVSTTLRDPNTAAAMLGVMTAVHYPTGGRTTFEYEGNDYANYEGDTGYPDFAPYMYNTPSYATRTTGGVRIKAIRDYDSATGTTPAYYRTYSYLDAGGHSSGVRGPMPRYGLSFIKKRVTGDHIDAYLGSYNNILPADGTHIEYAHVTEYLPQGRNVYSYITRLDCPDGKETWDNANIYNLAFDTEISPSITNEDALDAIFALMSPRTSMQAARGRLLSQETYDAQGSLKQTMTIAYEQYADAYETLDKFWNYQSLYLGATRVPTVIGDIRPLSTTTVSDGVTDTETLVYDAFRNVRSRTRGGLTSKTFYFQDIDALSSFSDFKDYAWWSDFINSSVYNRMKALNMVNVPLQTEAYDEEGILHIRRYIYGFRTALDMSAVYLQSIQERDAWQTSGTWRTVATYDMRDIRGRILQASDANGVPTVYVWGYGGLYPVAEIVGATLSQVRTVTGLSNIENAPLSGALSAAQVSALRALSGAEVTIREYAPLVGPTKETTPDGRSTYYTYTPAGKRYQTLDDLGRKTGAALYSIENTESISLSGNWTINRTYTNAAGTTSFEDITFYDGLGYADQIVQVAASPANAKNIVTPLWYDAMRRSDAKSYLPYVSTNGDRTKESTSSALSDQAAWYNANGWSGQGAYAFVEQEYEASPRDRVLKVRKSGSTYAKALSGSKAVQMTYAANAASEVRILSVNTSGALVLSGGYYAAGALHKVTSTDEDNCIAVRWTDVLGRTILSRQTAGNTTMDTYYVYDDAGHLCWVVSPEGSAVLGDSGTWALSDAVTDVNGSNAAKYCYIYTWDGRGRQLSRKIPGKAVEYFVYDRNGNLVMSQDGLQRASSLWVTNKYDSFGRPVRRALLSSTQGRASFQTLFEGSNAPASVYPSSGDVLLEEVVYGTYSGVPSTLAFVSVTGVTPTVDQTRVKGLKTWEKVAVLSGTGVPTSWIQRAFYYDALGRLIQTVEANAMGTTSWTSSGYDFPGNVVAAQEKHDLDHKSSTFTYDSRGRLLSESTSVNGTSATVSYAYDPLGRLKTTTSGSDAAAVATTDTYNIQGWLTSRTALKGTTNVFSMNLGYYSPVQSGATPRYSGDISSWSWTRGSNTAKAYGFAYDGAHRMTAGQYFNNGTSTNALSEKSITYDRAGNITSLTRYDNAGTGTTLQYTYAGNRRNSYGYDVNGNVSSDGTHSLQMAYNLINLPSQIDSGTIVKANYTYLSDGTKARALGASGAGYDYAGSFTFTHDANNNISLESVAFGGGRVRKNGSGYDVDYYITDHLGSVRAIVNASGTITEQNDYYPFGTRHPNGLTTLSGNRWRFSGKEEQDASLGVPYSDFGARLYDRTAWTAIDPLAEKYYAVSPYVYCHNNPISRVDVYGRWDVTIHLYKDRSEYGYGIAVVTDRQGNEIFSFIVRAEGTNGHNRMKKNSDTPLGIYDIPDDRPWIIGGERLSYGPNARLNMQGISGEIVDSGRSGIRIHGGRQEEITETGDYIAKDNPMLMKTQGCIRSYDVDILQLKIITDELQKNDEYEKPGQVVVIDDLIKEIINKEEVYYLPD